MDYLIFILLVLAVAVVVVAKVLKAPPRGDPHPELSPEREGTSYERPLDEGWVQESEADSPASNPGDDSTDRVRDVRPGSSED
jgi:hypothetical protein